MRLLDKAGKYYRSVLAKDAANIYAANGLGVVLSGRGRWADCKAVFSELKEVAPEVTDVWLNLGHVFTHHGLHTNAIKLVCGVCLGGFVCLSAASHFCLCCAVLCCAVLWCDWIG
jgi:hypothetical protein